MPLVMFVNLNALTTLATVNCAVYVPKFVYQSVWFWILLAITVAAILIHHNFKDKFKSKKPMTRSLTYNNQGRGGTVVYTDTTSSIRLDFEFGGGSCVAIIFIPTVDEWEKATKRSIGERMQILEFIAKQSLQDQVKGGYYEIKDRFIELYN